MARGIDEGDEPAVVLHLVGADGLGDPPGLPLGHVGLADGIEKGGLAVVDMAQHRHHRRTGYPALTLGFRFRLFRDGLRGLFLHGHRFLGGRRGHGPLLPHLFRQELLDGGGILLAHGAHRPEVLHPQLLQEPEELPGGYAEFFGYLVDPLFRQPCLPQLRRINPGSSASGPSGDGGRSRPCRQGCSSSPGSHGCACDAGDAADKSASAFPPPREGNVRGFCLLSPPVARFGERGSRLVRGPVGAR